MRLLQAAKRCYLLRKIASVLPSEWLWTLGAITGTAALQTTIATTSAELFDKQGKQLADELKARTPPDSVVLDFGCGIGRPEKFLSSYCKEIYGADISMGMLRLARGGGFTFSFVTCSAHTILTSLSSLVKNLRF